MPTEPTARERELAERYGRFLSGSFSAVRPPEGEDDLPALSALAQTTMEAELSSYRVEVRKTAREEAQVGCGHVCDFCAADQALIGDDEAKTKRHLIPISEADQRAVDALLRARRERVSLAAEPIVMSWADWTSPERKVIEEATQGPETMPDPLILPGSILGGALLRDWCGPVVSYVQGEYREDCLWPYALPEGGHMIEVHPGYCGWLLVHHGVAVDDNLFLDLRRHEVRYRVLHVLGDGEECSCMCESGPATCAYDGLDGRSWGCGSCCDHFDCTPLTTPGYTRPKHDLIWVLGHPPHVQAAVLWASALWVERGQRPLISVWDPTTDRIVGGRVGIGRTALLYPDGSVTVPTPDGPVTVHPDFRST